LTSEVLGVSTLGISIPAAEADTLAEPTVASTDGTATYERYKSKEKKQTQ